MSALTLVLAAGVVLLAGSAPASRAAAGRAELAAAKGAAGQRVRVEGGLEIIYEDGARGGRLHYYLRTEGKRLAVRFADDPPADLRTGARVTAEGSRDGGILTMDSGGGITLADATPAPSAANSSGEHRVLVILVNFEDKQTQPFTADRAREVAFVVRDDGAASGRRLTDASERTGEGPGSEGACKKLGVAGSRRGGSRVRAG